MLSERRIPQDSDLAAYVEFRELSAEYALALQGPNPEFAKIQAMWLQNLETFVGRHPKSPDTADALLQLGIAQEFAGQDDKAKTWYHSDRQRFRFDWRRPKKRPARSAASIRSARRSNYPEKARTATRSIWPA